MNTDLIYLKKLELYKELDVFRDTQFFAVADTKVKNHLPPWIQFSPNVLWLKNPEEKKNPQDYAEAVEFFLKAGVHRKSTLFAFGGGATTDFAGFVAATVLRGISWCAVPTTLLGMADAAIGGKVGLNMPQGKNLVGAFHAPTKVYVCGEFLTTLPVEEWISGKGEVLKYAFLSKDIYELVLKHAPIEDIAVACARFKAEVVQKDFYEQNERIFLNLGHTLGHAFEFQLKLPHGHAVAMGMKYLFDVMGRADLIEEWKKLMKALELPLDHCHLSHYPHYALKPFLDYLEQDKKKVDAHLRLVLVKEIGTCYLEDVSLKDFKAKIQAHGELNPPGRAT
jgi:3-dehydroquinate synthase